jgi:hypothetical protein
MLNASHTLLTRFRSTAALVSLILEAGYRCPHRTINKYVKVFTDFEPTDGESWTNHEPPLPLDFNFETKVTRLNFDKMSKFSF